MVKTINKDIQATKGVPPIARHTLFSGAILGAAVLGLGLFADSTEVQATEPSIINSNYVKVPTDNTVIPSKYSFIAKFTKNTKVKTFGTGALNEETQTGAPTKTWVNPSDASKGKIGIIYENIGYHEGKQIDLKITVNNWTPYLNKKEALLISYGTKSISHITGGYSNVNQTWKLIDHKTGKTAPIQGTFYTLTDLDSYQSIRLSNDTMEKINSIWVTRDTKVQYKEKKGEYFELGYFNTDLFDHSDTFARATILIDSPTFSFSWLRDYASAGISKDNEYTDYPAGSQYYGYVSEKPARTEISKPSKVVSDKDEELVKTNSIDVWNEKFTYTLSHVVPNEVSKYYYKSFVLEDDVISSLNVDSKTVKILNNDNKDVTTWFTNKSTGNKLKFTAKATRLSTAAFYDQTYRFVFDAKISASATPESLEKAGYKVDTGFALPNTTSAIVNGTTYKGNKVTTKVPKLVKTGIEKFNIDDKDKAVKTEQEVLVNKEHEYELDVSVGNEKDISKLVISDNLEDVLDLKSVKVMDGKTDVTSKGSLVVDDTKESFTWTATTPADFIAKTLKVTIKATMKDEQNLIPYSKAVEGKDDKVSIPNTAKLDINTSDKYFSNTVYVGTPPTKDAASKFNIKKVDNVLTKVMQLVEQGETHSYQLAYTVGNTKAISSLTLTDDLENVYDLETVIVKYKGKDVTEQGTLTYDKEAESFTWVAEKPMDWLGKILTVDIKAKMLQNITFNGYMKNNQIVVPNKGQMITELADKKKNTLDTNIVDVTVPIVKSQVEKNHLLSIPDKENINGTLSKETQLVKQGAEHNYQLKFNISNTDVIEKIVLKDDLEDVFDLNKIQVLYKGKEITNDGKMVLDKEKELFTWEANDPTKFYGDQLIVNVFATLKKDVDFTGYIANTGQILVPNVGKMVVNEKEIESPKVDIETPLIPSTAEKYNIIGGELTKDEPIINNAGKHQYDLEFKVTNAKKMDRLVLLDDLEDVLTPTKAVVTMNGKDITADGKLTMDSKTSKVTWEAKVPQKYAAQTLKLTIDATLKDSADLSPYVQEDGFIKIPNIGVLVLNEGKEKDELTPTPIVNIVTPGFDTSAAKFNVLEGSAKATKLLSDDVFASETDETVIGEAKPTPYPIGTKLKEEVAKDDTTVDSKVTKENPGASTPPTAEVVDLTSQKGVNHVIDVPTGGKHSYELLFKVSNKAKIDTLVISDDLEDVLDLEEVKVFIGNTDVTKEGTLKLDKDKESFTWTAKTPGDFLGKEIRVSILATLKTDTSLKQYLNESNVPMIPNTGQIVVNGTPTKTNEVGITTPLTETTVEKFNKSGDELTKDPMTIKLGEKHNYEIVYNISNEKDLTTLELTDDLEDILNLDSVKIFVREQDKEVDVTSKGTLELNDEAESFVWSPKKINDYVGKTITVKVGATLKKDGDITKYKDLIPNIAMVKVNDDKPVDSNKVDITTDKVKEPVPAVVTPPKQKSKQQQQKNLDNTAKEIQEAKVAKLVQTGREDNTPLMKMLGTLAGISLVGFGAVYVLFRRNRDDELDQNDKFL